jgi:hypothetical protein
MTTASELKSAAVVEVESEVRKTNVVKVDNAAKLDERCSSRDDTGFKSTTGSTTATATSQVVFARVKPRVKPTAKAKIKSQDKKRNIGDPGSTNFHHSALHQCRQSGCLSLFFHEITAFPHYSTESSTALARHVGTGIARESRCMNKLHE